MIRLCKQFKMGKRCGRPAMGRHGHTCEGHAHRTPPYVGRHHRHKFKYGPHPQCECGDRGP